MALALLAFDFDGIVLESLDPKQQAMAREGEAFGARFQAQLGPERAREAAERLVMYHCLHGGVSRVEKFRWLYREYLDREITPDELDAHCRAFTAHALDGVLAAPLVPGIMDTLEAWKGRVPMVVCSGTPQAELDRIVEHRGLGPFFTALYGTPPGKTALLRRALDEAGADPAHTVMVGDSSTDREAAEALGCLFYGRGETFAASGHPWHTDLTRLNAWLDQQAARHA